MGATTFSGPVKAGTVREGDGANVGYALLCQTYAIDMGSKGVANHDYASVMYLPAGATIVDIALDQTVVPGGTSTTTVSVGTAAGGAQLMAAVATTAGGRFRGTTTAATQLAWTLSTTADTAVHVRVAVGTDTTAASCAGVLKVTYVQQ